MMLYYVAVCLSLLKVIWDITEGYERSWFQVKEKVSSVHTSLCMYVRLK